MEPKFHPTQEKNHLPTNFHLWGSNAVHFPVDFPHDGGVMISESFPAEVATVKVTVP